MMAGSIYPQRLQAAAIAKPTAPRMHEAGASSLWQRLGFSPPSTAAPLLTIADWFNERTEEPA